MEKAITQEEINDKLKHDLLLMKEALLQALPAPPIAIYLCGGYGRGEGAWLRDELGRVIPYNDYDLAIITDSPLDRDRCNLLRIKLASLVGIHWVDIDFINIQRLKNLDTTIHNIDFLYASTLLYGDSSVLDLAPRLDPKQIGMYDLKVLNEIRIWTLLGSWKGEFHDLNSEEALFFRNQMAKSILAACDMILVKKKMYQTSYKERVKLICQLFKNKDDICNLSQWALNEKLHPTKLELGKDEMLDLYSKAFNLFIFARKESLGIKSLLLNKPELTGIFYYLFTDYLHNFISALYHRKKPTLQIKQLDIFKAQNYALIAWDKNGKYNRSYIKRASGLLKKWNYIKNEISDWNDLHYLVADARNNL